MQNPKLVAREHVNPSTITTPMYVLGGCRTLWCKCEQAEF